MLLDYSGNLIIQEAHVGGRLRVQNCACSFSAAVHYMGQGWCFCSVMGKDIQSRFPLKHPKTDTCLHLLGYLHMCPSVGMAASPEQLDPLSRRCCCARHSVWYLTSVTRQVTPQTATTHLSEQSLFISEHISPDFPCSEDWWAICQIHGLLCSRQFENSHTPSSFKGQVAFASKGLGPFQARSCHSQSIAVGKQWL